MKIALLTDGIHPYVIGGMQRHSFYLAKYFAANTVQVDLYHFNQSEYNIAKLEFFSEQEKNYIRSFVVEFPQKGLGRMFPGHYIRASYEYSKRIFEQFRKNSQVDFIYAKGFSAWKLLEEKKKGYACAPIGINFHGYEMFQKAPSLKSELANKFLLRKPVLYNIHNADFVFSYGGKISGIIQNLGIPKQKLIEAPAGIETNWLANEIKPMKEKIKFIFIGRYERRKGIEELSYILDTYANTNLFEFHFIGPIPPKLQLKCSGVKYHGAISSSLEIKKIMDTCDFLVCPSYSEGMPNAIIEAMARGLAIIATDVGAVNCLVNSENGFLMEQCSADNIQNALFSAIYLSHRQVFEMKNKSLERIRENFLWENIAKKLIGGIANTLHK